MNSKEAPDRPTNDEPYDDSDSSDEQQYQGLTAREEADLKRLMAQYEFTVQNARAFTEHLSREVSQLDASNIETIMASEESVESLMMSLNCAVEEIVRLEQRIEHFQHSLRNVRDVVLQVGRKESQVKTRRENRVKLEHDLQQLIDQLDLPADCERALLENDLHSRNGIRDCIRAADQLHERLHVQMHPALMEMLAVQQQRNHLEALQLRFSERLCTHIAAEVRLNVERQIVGSGFDTLTSVHSARDMAQLASHDSIHNALYIYRPLVKWLQSNNLDIFHVLCERYELCSKQAYERELSLFFEMSKEKTFVHRAATSGSSLAGSDSKRTTTNLSDTLSNSGGPTMTSAGLMIDNSDSVSGKSECSLSEWEEFDSALERILCAIDPLCLSEQQFCADFFHLDAISSGSGSGNTSVTSGSIGATAATGNVVGSNQVERSPFILLDRRVSSVSNSTSIAHSLSNESQHSNDPPIDRRLKTLREMMSKIFSTLESEFVAFVSHYDRLDGMYSTYLLVRLTQHVLSAQDKGSFLAQTYGAVLIHVKRNFDRYMKTQLQAIEDTRIPKKPKCGVFVFVKRFEQFARQAEQVFRNSTGRRADIDRWYLSLVQGMFAAIDRLAKEHHKTPAEMVALENYHYVHNVLCTLKIAFLENERKEAKKRYNDALAHYVSRYFGRPLERLNAFFEGVQQKVAQGVKEDEVGYQLAYSKQELRKVIKDCGLKEVKRGLEEMYRKVEKHISDPDSTLIQV